MSQIKIKNYDHFSSKLETCLIEYFNFNIWKPGVTRSLVLLCLGRFLTAFHFTPERESKQKEI